MRACYIGWMGKPSDEALRQDELCNRNMCALAKNFVDVGFTVLLDTVLADRPELDFSWLCCHRDPLGSLSWRPESTCASTETQRGTPKIASTSMDTNGSKST